MTLKTTNFTSTHFLLLFISLLIYSTEQSNATALLVDYSISNNAITSEMYFIITLDTNINMTITVNLTFQINGGNSFKSFFGTGYSHYDGDSTFIIPTNDAYFSPSSLPSLVKGPNILKLYQVDSSITMTPVEVDGNPQLSSNRTVYVYDNEPPIVQNIISVNFNGSKLYSLNLDNPGCFLDITFEGTDNYYGLEYVGLGVNSKQSATLVGGTKKDGLFSASLYIQGGTTYSSLFVWDGGNNRGLYQITPPIECLPYDQTWINDGSLLSQPSTPTAIYQQSVPEPFQVTTFTFNNVSTKFSFTTFNSTTMISTYAGVSPTSTQIVYTSYTMSNIYNLQITFGQFSSSINKSFAINCGQIPSSDPGVIIPQITYANLYPSSESSQLKYTFGQQAPMLGDIVSLLLEIIFVNPENITIIELTNNVDPYATIPIFTDSDVLSSIHNGTYYSKWIEVSIKQLTNYPITTFSILYYTKTNTSIFTFPVNITQPEYAFAGGTYVYGSELISMVYNTTVPETGQLQYILQFDMPPNDVDLPVSLSYYQGYKFPYTFKQVTPRSNITLTQLFTTRPKSISKATTVNYLAYRNNYIQDYIEPGISDAGPLRQTAISFIGVNQSKTHVFLEIASGNGLAYCDISQDTFITVGAEYIVSANYDLSRFTMAIPKSKFMMPVCRPNYYVQCYDREMLIARTKIISCDQVDFTPIHIRAKHLSPSNVSFEVIYKSFTGTNAKSVQLILTDPKGNSPSQNISLTSLASMNYLYSSWIVWNIPNNVVLVTDYQISLVFTSTVNVETVYSNEQLIDLKSHTTSQDRLGKYLSATFVKIVPIGVTDSLAPWISSFDAIYDGSTNRISVNIASNDVNGISSLSFVYSTSINTVPVVTNLTNSITSSNMSFVIPLHNGISTSMCGAYNAYFYVTNVCDRLGNCRSYNYFDFAKKLIIDDGTILSLEIPQVSLKSFVMSPKVFYPYSANDNDRKISITITVNSTVPISTLLPTIYITDIQIPINPHSYAMQIASITGTLTTYSTTLIIPKYLGYANLSVSLYGISDVCGNIIGFSQYDLLQIDQTNQLLPKICPNDCSGNGICENGQCKCNSDYTGTSCEISKSCNDNNGVVCSGHGVCLKSGFCSCDNWFNGAVCDQMVTFYPPYNISFDDNAPWCTYSVNGTYNNVSDPYSFNNTQNKFTFDIKFYSLIEVDINGLTVREEVFRNMNRQGTPTNFTMSKILSDDGASLTAAMVIASNSSTVVQWLGEDIRLPVNSVKYAMSLKGYKFKNPLNRLMVVWDLTSSSNFKDSSSCEPSSANKLIFGGSPNSFSYVKWPFYNYQLYARFPTRGLVDGRPIVVNNHYMNSTLLENNMYHVFLATDLPFFLFSTSIDPDFSVLVQDYKPTDSCSTTKDDGVNKAIIIGVVVGVVGFAILLLSIVLIVRKLGKSSRFIWFRKASLKMKTFS